MKGPFVPHALLRNAHLQTLFAGLPTRSYTPAGATARELRIELPDGDALHARTHAPPRPKRTTALLVHGLGGSSRSAYLVRAARAIHEAGHRVVALDLRGAGESAATSRALYHAGATGDLGAAIARVLREPGVEDLVVVGFSLGGQIALLAAAEWGSAPPPGVRAVVALCSPIDLAASSRKIERLRVRPYLRYVMRSLVGGALSLAERVPGAIALPRAAIAKLATIREYDEKIIAPMHGFASADAYYAACSSGPRLHRIATPTHVFAAEDDPMVPADTLRSWLARASPSVRVTWSAHGGHLGFVAALGDGLRRTWVNERLIEILA